MAEEKIKKEAENTAEEPETNEVSEEKKPAERSKIG